MRSIRHRAGVARIGRRAGVARIGRRAGVARVCRRAGIARVGRRAWIARIGRRAGIARIGRRARVARIGRRAGIAWANRCTGVARIAGKTCRDETRQCGQRDEARANATIDRTGADNAHRHDHRCRGQELLLERRFHGLKPSHLAALPPQSAGGPHRGLADFQFSIPTRRVSVNHERSVKTVLLRTLTWPPVWSRRQAPAPPPAALFPVPRRAGERFPRGNGARRGRQAVR